jgi:hypothetical protein
MKMDRFRAYLAINGELHLLILPVLDRSPRQGGAWEGPDVAFLAAHSRLDVLRASGRPRIVDRRPGVRLALATVVQITVALQGLW